MHVALIRNRVTHTLVALLATVAFATAVAPMIAQTDDGRPEPAVSPGGICPPYC